MREDGTVLYAAKDEVEVSKIRFSVLQSSFVPSTRFADEHLEALFLERLTAEHISYGVQIRDGQRWITWSQHDDERAETIRRSVLDAR